MTIYSNFIGIDIGKNNFFASVYGQKTAKEYKNNPADIALFIKAHGEILSNSLCVLETTGGYEMQLLLTLCHNQIAVHRANTRRVKNFIRSCGNGAKTDSLDAKALALYGSERHSKLELFKPTTERALELQQLHRRREELVKMIVAEKNRLKAPNNQFVKKSVEDGIAFLSQQISSLTESINAIIQSSEVLQKCKETLETIPGIGEITANKLLVAIPELGSLDKKEAASLCGLAPKANDSGNKQGYRPINKGRSGIKPILFTAAMAARRSHSKLKDFYEGLIARDKKKMVALVALMRKILVIANAKLKEIKKMKFA